VLREDQQVVRGKGDFTAGVGQLALSVGIFKERAATHRFPNRGTVDEGAQDRFLVTGRQVELTHAQHDVAERIKL
jgi:hypothetical protein